MAKVAEEEEEEEEEGVMLCFFEHGNYNFGMEKHIEAFECVWKHIKSIWKHMKVYESV